MPLFFMADPNTKALGRRTLSSFDPKDYASWSINCKTYELTHNSGYPRIDLETSRNAYDLLDDIFHFSGKGGGQGYIKILKTIFNSLSKRREGWTKEDAREAVDKHVEEIMDYCINYNINESKFLIR